MKRNKTNLDSYKVYYRNFWVKKLLFSLKAFSEKVAIERINNIIRYSYSSDNFINTFNYKKIIITCNDVEIYNCDIKTYFNKYL